ncbi:MAG: DUF3422 family protein [Acidimicrobiales bacterium]|nr:DUF3422 domain-containing protein [Hyphomonadaceae bacterium]RZV41145.1 MAG: DUF3422 family protein [Acidimicrobiales bacterium]
MGYGAISDHPLRAGILQEMHARPYTPISTPRTILRQAFLFSSAKNNQPDNDAFAAWCKQNEVSLPQPNTRHHSVKIGEIRLTWERHSEFTSLTWDSAPFRNAEEKLIEFAQLHTPSILGSRPALIAAAKLVLVSQDKSSLNNLLDFHRDSLCMSTVGDGKAVIMTDFRQDLNGSTKYAIHNNGLDDASCGILVRRLLEIETYRCLALLGFEEVKSVSSKIADIETELSALTEMIGDETDLESIRGNLNRITDISADLVKLSASSQFRLSATRAYYQLVNARLTRIAEQPMQGYRKIEEFMGKRLAPAMRTCANVENRIAAADRKLSGATDLLRTKVDIQVQAQNNELLETMNKRALMQYRLQSTVEGLSIAAISYYIVGLVSYLVKGMPASNMLNPSIIIAMAVPISLLLVWSLIRKVRKAY